MRVSSVFGLLNWKKIVRHIRKNAKVDDVDDSITGERKK